ncbi:MAG: carboxypeptidase regulatory-like domain-containing protein [Planctomycetes bacterium]|nr:carboxypeptidase regulatory-like domain-containing protein [Planctomycetota bacterium]
MRKIVISAILLIIAALGAFVFVMSGGARVDEGIVTNNAPREEGPTRSNETARVDSRREHANSGAEIDREAAGSVIGFDEKDLIKIHGKVIFADGSAPKERVLVKLYTNDFALNDAQSVSLVGGRREWDKLTKMGALAARLRALGGRRRGFGAMADAAGKFEIAAPKAMKQFTFDVQGDFVAYRLAEWFDCNFKSADKEYTIIAEPAGLVDVAITNAGGAPASGAWAIYTPAAPRWSWFGMADGRDLTADAGGHVLVRGVPRAGGALRATAPGCAPAELKLSGIRAGATTKLNLTLPAGEFARGSVVNEKGAPLAGAFVNCSPERGQYSDLNYGSAVSDAEGNFTFEGLLKGHHWVAASMDGLIQLDGPKEFTIPVEVGQPGMKFVLGPGTSLEGKVVDENGRGISDAVLRAASDYENLRKDPEKKKIPNTARDGATNSDGSFKLAGLGDGIFTITATVDGRGTVTLDNIEKNSAGLLITVPPGVAIFGTVANARTGAPVAGAYVSIADRRRKYTLSGESSPNAAKTDERGNYELRPVQPGKYDINAVASGYLQKSENGALVNEGGKKQTILFQLDTAATVHGTVSELGTGSPVAGAIVSISSLGDKGLEEMKYRGEYFDIGMQKNRAVTGPDGKYELSGIAPGEARVTAIEERHVDGASAPFAATEGTSPGEINIIMQRGGGVDGTALRDQKKPYFGGTATATSEDDNDNKETPYQRPRTTEIDENGYFKIEGLLPGKWLVKAQGSGGKKSDLQALAGHAVVEEGRITSVQFLVPKEGCNVQGRVTRGGQPVASASILINYKQKPNVDDPFLRERLNAQTNEDGMFTMKRLPGGAADAIVRVYDRNSDRTGQNRWTEAVTLPDSGNFILNIDIPAGGEIHGRVTARVDGRPLAGISVTAEPARDENSKSRVDTATVRTDEKGNYVFSGLMPARYIISARPDAKSQEMVKLIRKQSDPVSLSDSETLNVDLALESGAAIVVQVLDETGGPLANIRVAVEGSVNVQDFLIKGEAGEMMDKLKMMEEHMAAEGRPGGSMRRATTDAKGIARIDGVAPGRVSIRADRPGYAAIWSEPVEAVSSGEAATTIQFESGTTLQIHVVDASGAAVAISNISIAREDGTRVFSKFSGGSADSGDARVQIKPGKYTIAASGKSGSASVKVEVSGSAQTVNINLNKK